MFTLKTYNKWTSAQRPEKIKIQNYYFLKFKNRCIKRNENSNPTLSSLSVIFRSKQSLSALKCINN